MSDVIDEREEEMNAHSPSGVISAHSFDDGFIGLVKHPDIADDDEKQNEENDGDDDESDDAPWQNGL
jgi:hypothetical protein